jgi:hypothetical protein
VGGNRIPRFDARPRSGRCTRYGRIAPSSISRITVVDSLAVDAGGFGPRTAVEDIEAIAAIEEVVAIGAVEEVVASAADDVGPSINRSSAPPQMMSPPPRPKMRSLPSRPTMISSPGVPVMTSLPGAPKYRDHLFQTRNRLRRSMGRVLLFEKGSLSQHHRSAADVADPLQPIGRSFPSAAL